MCDRPYLCDEEKCMVLELERACYNEMERESMEYFYAAEKELQRQRERIRQLEKVRLKNSVELPVSKNNYTEIKQQYISWRGGHRWNIG